MTAPYPLHARLRRLREARGLSLPQAAAAMGIKPAKLGSYERCERQAPSQQLDRVLRFYGERLTSVPTDVTDEQVAEALTWIRARGTDTGVVELGAVA